jgi:hypothetical protein
MAALLPVHVHNILLGRTLTRVYLAGTGCVCASTAVAYKRKVFPSTLCPTVRHRGLVAGVVPNCALSSRLMFCHHTSFGSRSGLDAGMVVD